MDSGLGTTDCGLGIKHILGTKCGNYGLSIRHGLGIKRGLRTVPYKNSFKKVKIGRNG